MVGFKVLLVWIEIFFLVGVKSLFCFYMVLVGYGVLVGVVCVFVGRLFLFRRIVGF